jgi:FkbM family methyltransferase
MIEAVIYDFGSNNGDDIPYYLQKADRVVAVEANPVLASHIRDRFKGDIASNRLVVESCVLTVDDAAPKVPFYLHKTHSTASQFPAPTPAKAASFEQVLLPSKNVIELIKQHGEPHYIKIDIEHYDQVILRHLFLNNIRPPYISAESHSIDVFCLLVSLGEYKAFKLVDGSSVSRRYADCSIGTPAGPVKYSFPHHSAGPFGKDISGKWMTKANFIKVLVYAGLGWRDVHASNIDLPDAQYAPKPHVKIGINY